MLGISVFLWFLVLAGHGDAARRDGGARDGPRDPPATAVRGAPIDEPARSVASSRAVMRPRSSRAGSTAARRRSVGVGSRGGGAPGDARAEAGSTGAGR